MTQPVDRSRGQKRERPSAKALYAAREATGSLRGAARVLGVPASTAARWYRELESGTESEPPTGVDLSDPVAVRDWTLRCLVRIAGGDGTPALTALDKLAAMCGTTGGAGEPHPVDLWARKLLAAGLRDFLAGLEGDEKAIYIAAAKPRATVDEIEALAKLLAGTRWVVRLERD